MKQIANAFDDVSDQRSFALRLVIHYLGDVHQPLHAVSEVDHYYPKGDAGGNFEHVPEVGDTGVTNLHSIWDSVIYEFPGYPKLVSISPFPPQTPDLHLLHSLSTTPTGTL